MKTASISEIGLVREVNQDATFLRHDEKAGVFLVADGMGGYFAGNEASQAVADALQEFWDQYSSFMVKPDFDVCVRVLENLLDVTGGEIHARTPARKICGTTVSLMWVLDDKYAILNVGDSRVYSVERRLFNVRRTQLTTDDVNPENGHLRYALGAEKGCPIQKRTGKVRASQIFVLCTDGVYKHIPDAIFRRALDELTKNGDWGRQTEAIKKEVLNYGAKDNFSLAVVGME